MTFLESAQILGKLVATALRGPRRLAAVSRAATLSVAQTLAELVKSQLAGDIRRIKESQIAGMEAEASRKLADAVLAANNANRLKATEALIECEAEERRAVAEKTRAEADAILRDARTREFAEVSKARATLIDAIARLRSEGGDLLLDSDGLAVLLGNRHKDSAYSGCTTFTATVLMKSTQHDESADNSLLCHLDIIPESSEYALRVVDPATALQVSSAEFRCPKSQLEAGIRHHLQKLHPDRVVVVATIQPQDQWRSFLGAT